MIIDSHHHMLPLTYDEKVISHEAEYRYRTYGPVARGGGVKVTLDEIKKRIASYAPDPHGEKLLERMASEGIDYTVLLVTDNMELGASDEELIKSNRICAGIARESKGKIIGLAGVDPRRKKAPEIFR